MLSILLVSLCAQAGPTTPPPLPADAAPVVDAPSTAVEMEKLAPEAPAAPTTPTTPATPPAAAKKTPLKAQAASGVMGGTLGALGGCAAGTGAPATVVGVGTAILVNLYTGAGTVYVGALPSLAAVGTASTMCGALTCLPACGAGLATAGAVYGVIQDGRDPLYALLGSVPGLSCAGISLLFAGITMVIGTVGFISTTVAVPALITTLVAVLTGVAAPPCAVCGAVAADLIWGRDGVVAGKPESPPPAPSSTTTKPAAPKTAMVY